MTTHRNAKLPLHLLVAMAAVLAFAGSAHARTYTVLSCNSAVSFGSNASAWEPFSSAGSTYETCPTNGGFTAGVSNRMTGQAFGGFSYSGHAFNAPPGTTITQIRWAGRIARNNCTWGTFIRAMPSQGKVLGLRNGEYCDETNYDFSNYPISYPVPPGTTRLEQLVVCGSFICDPGAAMHSHSLEVTIDDPQPPSISLSGRMVSGQWVSGTAGHVPQVDISAEDSSGVQVIDAMFGSQHPSQSFGCNWSLSRPCLFHAAMISGPSVAELSDGRHTLLVSATDAAGNIGTAARDVLVDNTPPDPVVPEIEGGSGWRRTSDYTASWTNPPSNASPIVRAHWKLCGGNGACPIRAEVSDRDVHQIEGIRPPAAGEYQLFVWLEDAAGNQREANAAVSVPLRYDPDPPALAFAAPDPSDPLRVAVDAIDQHSGLAGGEIEMRAAGGTTWHGLHTEVQGTQLVAYVDDERSQHGLYEFRAHAEDNAGNEASTVTRGDGARASLRLPARIDTRLALGVRASPHGRLRRSVRMPIHRSVHLTGRLTNVDGQPIEFATIEALEKATGGVTPLGLVTTSRTGRFRYILRANRNREVVFRYGGSRRIGVATATFHLRVPGASSMSASRRKLRNGQSVLFTGRVASRPIPREGKLLEMQAHFRGRWRTFSTLRTDAAGSWRFRYRFGATVGRVPYRFRARLPVEGGYPFITGRSRGVTIVVVGP